MPRNEKEIREEIITTTNEYMHVLECYPASIQVNQPRAVMQIFAKTNQENIKEKI